MNNKRNKAGRPPLCISLLLDIAVINFSTRSLEDLRDKFIRQLCRILSNNNFGSRFRELEHAKKIKVDGIGYLPDYLKIQLEDIPKKKRKFTKKKINEMNDKIFQFQNQVIEVYANCLLGGNFDEKYLSYLFQINLIPEIDDIKTKKEIWTCLIIHLSLSENDKESITFLNNKINELISKLSKFKKPQILLAGDKSILNNVTNQSFDIEMLENSKHSNPVTLSIGDRLNLDKSTCSESSSSIKKFKLKLKSKSNYKEDMSIKINFPGRIKFKKSEYDIQRTEDSFGFDEDFLRKAQEIPQVQIEQSNSQQGIIIQDINGNQDDMDLDIDEKTQEASEFQYQQKLNLNSQKLVPNPFLGNQTEEAISLIEKYSFDQVLIPNPQICQQAQEASQIDSKNTIKQSSGSQMWTSITHYQNKETAEEKTYYSEHFSIDQELMQNSSFLDKQIRDPELEFKELLIFEQSSNNQELKFIDHWQPQQIAEALLLANEQNLFNKKF